MLSIKVDGPFVEWPGFETAKNCMSIIVLCFRVGHEWRGSIRIESESADGFFDASPSVSITEVNRIVLIELVVAFDRILDLSRRGSGVYVTIVESNRIGARATSQGKEIGEKCSALDLEGFNFERI